MYSIIYNIKYYITIAGEKPRGRESLPPQAPGRRGRLCRVDTKVADYESPGFIFERALLHLKIDLLDELCTQKNVKLLPQIRGRENFEEPTKRTILVII